jgi:hypothetical protein
MFVRPPANGPSRHRAHRFALIAAALLVASPAVARAQADARRIFPRHIIVSGDTIWFAPDAADERDDRTRRALGFVIAEGAWIEARIARSRIPAPSDRPAPLEYGEERSGAHVVATLRPGIDLLHVGDTVVQKAHGWPGRVYAVRLTTNGRVSLLVVPRAWRRHSAERPDDTASEIGDYATDISTWTASGDTIWFGTWAGPSYVRNLAVLDRNPPARWKGALLQYDAASAMVTPILDERLEEHVVTSIVRDGDWLWIGTDRRDYLTPRARAESGLLAYRPSDRQWRQFLSGYSPLPGNAIGSMTAVGDLLAILTDSGAAVLRTTDESWSVHHFSETIRNDSLVWVASTLRPSPDSVLWAARRLARYLREPRLTLVLHGARLAKREPLLALLATRDDPGARDASGAPLPFVGVLDPAADALADPAFLPLLLELLPRRDGEARLLISEALLRDPDPRARAAVRAVLDTGSLASGLHLAGRLAMRGDADARTWLLTRLADPKVRADTVPRFEGEQRMATLDTLVETFVALGDSTMSHAMLDLLDSPAGVRAMRGIIVAGSFTDQRTLGDSVMPRPRLWGSYLEQFVPAYTGADAPPALPFISDAQVRATAVRIARLLARAPDSTLASAGAGDRLQRDESRRSACDVLVRFGGAPAVPFLVDLFGRPDLDTRLLAESLVRLTGVATAPGVRESNPDATERQRQQEFWRHWWSQYGARYRRLSEEESRRAVDAWRRLAGMSHQH